VLKVPLNPKKTNELYYCQVLTLRLVRSVGHHVRSAVYCGGDRILNILVLMRGMCGYGDPYFTSGFGPNRSQF